MMDNDSPIVRPMSTRQAADLAREAEFPRLCREFKTISTMLRTYCRVHHPSNGTELCPACAGLRDYARRRLEYCRFGENKPACVNCPVHCYKTDMREAVRQVMRWAGPRLLLHHPLLAIRHLIDERRP